MSRLFDWMRQMVGEEVELETDDNQLVGRLDEVTEDPVLSVRMSSVTDCDEEELGETVVSWAPGYRISRTDD